jgi:hypothetical protein
MARDEVTVRVPKTLLVVVLVLLVGCAVGALGFFLGRDSAPEETTVATTPAKGAGETQDEGGDGDESTPDAEPEAEVDGGAARTYAQGLREGREQGFERGYREGASEALAIGQFNFDPATFYVVQFAAVDGGAGLEISGSDQMLPGRSYLLCNTNDLCTQ